jgi:hypothetical protein
VDLDISDVLKAVEDWEKAAARIGAGMRPAVDSSLLTARGAARNAAPKVTHRLENSIDMKITRSDATSASGILEATAKHAKFVLESTAPHEIRARNGGTLAFQSGGRTVFARSVHHPGTKANDFITPTGDVAESKLESAVQSNIDATIGAFTHG